MKAASDRHAALTKPVGAAAAVSMKHSGRDSESGPTGLNYHSLRGKGGPGSLLSSLRRVDGQGPASPMRRSAAQTASLSPSPSARNSATYLQTRGGNLGNMGVPIGSSLS